MKKFLFYVTSGLLAIVFRAFVAMKLWNWFVPQVFHVSEVSFLQAVGLFLVVRAFVGFNISQPNERFWNESDTTEKLRAQIRDLMFSKFMWVAVLLAAGYAIHLAVG